MIPARALAAHLAIALGVGARVRAAGRYVHVQEAGDPVDRVLTLRQAFEHLVAIRRESLSRSPAPTSPAAEPQPGKGHHRRQGPLVGGPGGLPWGFR